MATDTSDDVQDLMARAMIGLDDDDHQPSSDNPTGWLAMSQLRRIASREVLDAGLAACTDTDPLKRRLGAAVLGQLGHSKTDFQPVFAEERYQGLAALLAAEQAGTRDPEVLAGTCIALGHLQDPRAIPFLLELAAHPDEDVRYGVVSGLSCHEMPEAIDGLIALSSDVDEHIRDWATFGLGQLIHSDTPAIRAALHARLDDPYPEVRNEAIEGLATRGDLSVIPSLIGELHIQNASPLFEAAIALARPELCEALAASAAHGLAATAHRPNNLTECWQKAMQACGCRKPAIPSA